MAIRKRTGLVALLAAALMIGVPPAGVVHAAETAGPALKGEHRTVTLVTGDRVEVYQRGDRQIPQVRPGKGRKDVTFFTSRANGHLYVIPSDALGLVGRRQLDRRLFDVTRLLKLGYGDAKREDLPLLVQGATAEDSAEAAGARVTRELPAVGSVSVRQPKRTTAGFWSAMARDMSSGVKRIWLDGKRRVSLDESVPQVGAPTAWKAGYTGKGVKVAVLDTGIDAAHPDFKNRIGAKKNFTDAPDTNDTVGHGTHVASTIAGTGAASSGRYKGVAPAATLLIGKVCGDVWCEESAILAGMQWAAQSGAKVANLSLGGGDSPEVDPLEQAVNDLTATYGTLFVIAAGNDGDDDETVSSPASADAALAVGAVDKSDKLAGFSSRGPRIGDAALKPEITAPGAAITAANAKDGFLGEPGKKYTTLSGTSMATPHVAGSAALLAQRRPGWKAGQLKSALVGAAKTLPGLTAYQQGAGRADIGRAIRQSGYADPAVVSAGVARWPHHDDKPVTKTVTYHNPTSKPVTYALKLATRGPDGQPAAAGTFKVSADQVTVPAGGAARVDVTVDTTVASPDGYYSAWVTATAGTVVLTTPVAVNKEVESYDVTVDVKDRTGAPAEQYLVVLTNLDTGKRSEVYSDPDGHFTLRLAKGRYHAFAFVDTGDTEASLLAYPRFEVSGDATLNLHAEAAKPISVRLPEAEAKLGLGSVQYVHRWSKGSQGSGIITDDFSRVSSAHLGPALPRDELVSEVSGAWGIPDADGNFAKTPRAYHLNFYEYGRLMTGFSKQVQERELAAVKAKYRAQGKGKSGVKFWMGSPPGWGFADASGFVMPLPASRTEYINPRGVNWETELWLVKPTPDGWPEDEGALYGGPVDYKAGRTYSETWNAAVFGPGFGGSIGTVSRTGNKIKIRIPMYADSAGHAGFWYDSAGRTRLYRNGTKIGDTREAGYADVKAPAAAGNYRLRIDATRTGSPHSTKQICEWTFRSGHTDDRKLLPVATVGFSPKVDSYNLAKAGGRQLVPVTLRTMAGAKKVKVRSLTVDVSYDDGKTWKKVKVSRSWGGGWLAHIAHPTGKKHVSLRATLKDKYGNTAKETIIRAYGLK